MRLTIVEDDEDDLDFLKEGLCDLKEVEITHLKDGIELLNTLNQNTDLDNPNAVILDLHLPCKDGLEILVELKSSERHKSIPVIILTSSILHEKRCIDAGCDRYYLKPNSIKEYRNVAEEIIGYLEAQ